MKDYYISTPEKPRGRIDFQFSDIEERFPPVTGYYFLQLLFNFGVQEGYWDRNINPTRDSKIRSLPSK